MMSRDRAANHDLTIELAENVKYIREKIDKIEERLGKGDALLLDHDRKIVLIEQCGINQRAQLAKHIDGHWKFVTVLISASTLIFSAAVFVGHLLGVL